MQSFWDWDLIVLRFSRFGWCPSLPSLSYTCAIPILAITGKADAKYKDDCSNVSTSDVFAKRLELPEVKRRLVSQLQHKRSELRAHGRVRMRLTLNLRGKEANGRAFTEMTTTENISADGFMCNCTSSLLKGSIVEVLQGSGGEQYVGRAQVVRKDSSTTPWQRYGFQFQQKSPVWPLQESSILGSISGRLRARH